MTNYRDFAIETAREAGEILLDNFGKIKDLEWNQITHFKTVVDDLSDRLIRRRIRENFPEHSIHSEENESHETGSELSWVFDSLDGTIPFTYGITDHFSVNIALVRGKTPILGVTYAPKRGELYVAEEGKGAFLNDSRITVSSESNVNHALIGIDGGKATDGFKRSEISKYMEKLYSDDGVNCTLCSGCASVPLALVASGRLHSYMALSLEPWDMAAGVILNREAGARVTNLEDKEWGIEDRSILVANRLLHRKLYNHIAA